MNYDTAENPIIGLIDQCDCGLTGGCEKCNPNLWKTRSYKPKKPWDMLDELPITDEEYDYYEKLPPLGKSAKK